MKTMLKILTMLVACVGAIAALYCAINTVCEVSPIKKYVSPDDDDDLPF